MVREKKDSYEPIFIRGTAVGVVLCILAVIPTIIAESMEASDYYCGLSVGLLLFILAIGVNLLVRVGMVKSSYDTLLQEGEYTKEEKLFKKKTSLGIIEYFSHMKINTAKELIRTGQMNFTQISEHLGYTSIHYFSRQFKKVTAMTPSEYASSIKAMADGSF